MMQNGQCKKVEVVCSYKNTTILHMQNGDLKYIYIYVNYHFASYKIFKSLSNGGCKKGMPK